jgi:VanZ family protein
MSSRLPRVFRAPRRSGRDAAPLAGSRAAAKDAGRTPAQDEDAADGRAADAAGAAHGRDAGPDAAAPAVAPPAGPAPHRSSATLLALAYACLVVYASLYPFDGWRNQGIPPWNFAWQPLPYYWTAFDVVANAVGYAPLGFLLALGALRADAADPAHRIRRLLLWTAAAPALSFGLEMLQGYLPSRVSSNLDLFLNTLGALAGAAVAWLLERLGAVARWSRLRARWFVEDARGALVLLALWPAALLFPLAVPFGLGQVLDRLADLVDELLAGTPFADWFPLPESAVRPMMPAGELLCVLLGLLIPCLLAYCVVRTPRQRLATALLVLAAGVLATALSTALTYGPPYAWDWLDPPTGIGLALAPACALLALPVPRRGCAALGLLALAIHLNLLNDAPAGVYFDQTLQLWEQGRFIRFHGLGQWLGWLWPYAALAYVVARLARREPAHRPWQPPPAPGRPPVRGGRPSRRTAAPVATAASDASTAPAAPAAPEHAPGDA